jgi:hypothetical protein
MYIFEKEYAVGVKLREHENAKFQLGFVTKTDKTSNASFKKWIDKSIPVRVFSNTPSSGFEIFGSTKRSNRWYGSGRNLIYIKHPVGFVFEISVENLLQILTTEDITMQKFTGQYILAHEGNSLVLIPTSSDLYGEAIKDTHISKTISYSPEDLKIGDEVLFTDKRQLTYLGYYSYFDIQTYWKDRSRNYELKNIRKGSSKRHFFAPLNSDGSIKFTYLEKAPKIHNVIGHKNIDVVEMFKNYINGKTLQKSDIPILSNNISFDIQEHKQIESITGIQVEKKYSKILEITKKGFNTMIKYEECSNCKPQYLSSVKEELKEVVYEGAKIIMNYEGLELTYKI